MSLLIRTDVTAVKIFEKYILAGIGSSVSVYSKENLGSLSRIQCLTGQKIYGFVPNETSGNILVYGGKQFTILSLESSENNENEVKAIRRTEPVICDDWLHSGAWLNGHSVAVLTAHNTVQVWNVFNNERTSQHLCKQNSILYSGLVIALQDGILVFAGTVFSQVIIHAATESNPLHYLKGHRGVIFSVSVDLKKGIIVTTSDDRSVRIWEMELKSENNIEMDTIDYWRNISITCTHEVYGHAARVMRSCITEQFIISVGEDSAVCYWSYKGRLLKKYLTHQNGCIWSVDADETSVVTGGGDCGIIVHPLTTAFYQGKKETFNFDKNPKKIAFTARRNLIVLDDTDNLVYYNLNDKTEIKYKLIHDSTYKLLSISNCKQLIAVCDMNGKLDVFAENCKDEECLTNLIDTRLDLGKILSMHWAGNRHLVFCADKGVITVVSSGKMDVEMFAVFMLPPCKERWLTAAAMDLTCKCLIVGDRCGNVHIYLQGAKNPYKSFNRVHGRYGPTSITIKNKEFITTGRNGAIKYFMLSTTNKSSTKYMSTKEVEFQWVEKFIDKEEKIVCGFQERTFVVFDVTNYCKMLEVACGGGHRSWDVVRYIDKAEDGYDEFIRLAYVKNSDVHSHIFQMSKVVLRNVISGSHSKEINCLKSFDSKLGLPVKFYITGGEDTTLRVSSVDSEQKFQDEVVFKHLSNVRTLKIADHRDGILVVSAGGRAQICMRLIKIVNNDGHHNVLSEELVNFMIKGTDKERRNNQTWRDSTIDFDPETRIMDLDIKIIDNDVIVIYAGCSDAYLRIFTLLDKQFVMIGEVKHHSTCILKTVCVKVSERDILLTCTTRGEVALWEVNQTSEKEIAPFFTFTSNKSGINAIDTKVLPNEELLIATGGDDNAVILSLLEVPIPNDGIRVKSSWSTDTYHCSQVTGVKIIEEYLLTTSIDQRVTLCRWSVAGESIEVEFLTQIFSDVADIQGLDILNICRSSITVCVFGKGIEVLRVPLPEP